MMQQNPSFFFIFLDVVYVFLLALCQLFEKVLLLIQKDCGTSKVLSKREKPQCVFADHRQLLVMDK